VPRSRPDDDDLFAGLSEEAVADHRADRLKERVYVTFTALAVVLALRSHPEEGHPGRTLLITVAGTLLAAFVADVIAHIAVHQDLPDRRELRMMLGITGSALVGVAAPLVFVWLGSAGVWDLERSLNAAMVALIAALVAIGWIAVRRVRLAWWKKAIVLFAEFLLGFAVIAVELLAHG
jgi:FtsH-binding integral membrane protein